MHPMNPRVLSSLELLSMVTTFRNHYSKAYYETRVLFVVVIMRDYGILPDVYSRAQNVAVQNRTLAFISVI